MNGNKSTNPKGTLLIITVGFVILFLITENRILLYTVVTIGLLGSLSSWFTNKIDFLWMKLSWLLSLIVSNIVLIVIFFLILVPISFLSKVFQRKDALKLKNHYQSYFVNRKDSFSKEFFEKIW